MKFYQVRDKKTGRFYKRNTGKTPSWTDQEEASVWTTPAGPHACIGAINHQNYNMARFGPAYIRDPEIMVYTVPAEASIKVGLVRGDDWEGLYLDGKLVEEGHHFRLTDVLARFGIECDEVWPDDSWLEERGSLPKNFEEVPR